MNCPACHKPKLSLLGRSLGFGRDDVEVALDYLCPQCQKHWKRTGEIGLKIEQID